MAWYRVSFDPGPDFTGADLLAAQAALRRFGQVLRTSDGGPGPEGRLVLLVDSPLGQIDATAQLNAAAAVAVDFKAGVGAGQAWAGDLGRALPPAGDDDRTDYQRLRARCSAASGRVLTLHHLGPTEVGPTDRESSLARMRRNVLDALMKDAHETAQLPAESAGVLVMSAAGGRGYLAPVRLGAGPTAVADAGATVELFQAEGGLLASIDARLHEPVPDALLGGVFQLQVRPTGDGRARTAVARALFADGSALELTTDAVLARPTPQTLVATDPVAETTPTIAPDPLGAPGFPALAELLLASLDRPTAPRGPTPAPRTSELDAVRRQVDVALRQRWSGVVENELGHVVAGWTHAGCLVEVTALDDDEPVVRVHGMVLQDVPATDELLRFVAQNATATLLATLGVAGGESVTLRFTHCVPARDLTADNLQVIVTRLGRLAEANALPLRERFGGATFL